MKKFITRNRLIILGLSAMIGVAGYMNFREGNETKKVAKDNDAYEVVKYENAENMELQDTDASSKSIELNSDEDSIGEAVLTSASAQTENMASLKLEREQSRSRAKEYLMSLVNDETLDEVSRKEATDAYVALSDNIEKENSAETILAAKGYDTAIVTISDESVDVAIPVDELSDTDRAQIEDIVTRKTGYNISQVVISVNADK